jgi:hypothetical protein
MTLFYESLRTQSPAAVPLQFLAEGYLQETGPVPVQMPVAVISQPGRLFHISTVGSGLPLFRTEVNTF